MTTNDKSNQISNLTFSKQKFTKSRLATAVGGAHKKYANGFDRPSVLLNLEPRMMFDGAAPLEADELLGDSSSSVPESLPEPIDVETQSQAVTEIDGIADSLESDAPAETVTLLDAEQALGDDGLEVDDFSVSLSDHVVSDDAVYSPIESSFDTELDAQEQELLDESVEELDIEEESDVEDLVVDESKVTRVVFIDTSVTDYEDLLNGVVSEIEMGAEEAEGDYVAGADVVSVSSEFDVANPSTAPPAELALDAIDVISHGTVGEFQLGNQRINSETLSDYADELKGWGDALAEDGDILIHACDTAGDELFLASIAELTGADVAGWARWTIQMVMEF